MPVSKVISDYWADFCLETEMAVINEPYQVWYFGNTPEMALELAGLVIEGKKTATASLAYVNDIKPEEKPVDGGYSVVTDFDGKPLCVIATTGISHAAFEDVDAQFAFDEGEGDRTLQSWREAHWRYFSAEATSYGIDFGPRSSICCEHFKVLFSR